MTVLDLSLGTKTFARPGQRPQLLHDLICMTLPATPEDTVYFQHTLTSPLGLILVNPSERFEFRQPNPRTIFSRSNYLHPSGLQSFDRNRPSSSPYSLTNRLLYKVPIHVSMFLFITTPLTLYTKPNIGCRVATCKRSMMLSGISIN